MISKWHKMSFMGSVTSNPYINAKSNRYPLEKRSYLFVKVDSFSTICLSLKETG